jgi:mono/diheme cytochrome c family protein
MRRLLFAIPGTLLLAFGVAGAAGQAPRSQAPVPAPSTPPASTRSKMAPAASQPRSTLTASQSTAASGVAADAQTQIVKQYCVTCHSDRGKAGGLTLAAFDAARLTDHVEVAEKMIRKLRAGMMPPAGARRPEEETLQQLASAFESRIDRAAALAPNPGYRPFQRLNRAEYERAVRDMLSIDIDVESLLPPDTISHGFDNIADVQTMTPTVLDGYLRAAARVSRDALGDATTTPTSQIYPVPRTAAQLWHVEGAPMGTRGGISLVHVFPADGEYRFRMMMHSIPTGQLYGSTTRGEQIEVSVNGVRKALIDINPRMSESDPKGINIETEPISVRAGPQRISAAFLARAESPVDDLIKPIDFTLADTQIGSALGITTLPHLRELEINGPHKVTGVSDTVSRRRVFICRPTAPAEEAACAEKIVRHLATTAFRRPVGGDEVRGLVNFYENGRAKGDFESGVREALQAILASPQFIFRLERAPAGVKPGQNYRITDIDLASRLSYFLWSTVPDKELVDIAMKNQLRAPGVLEAQVKRMLQDPRSETLATRFASLWLRLQDLDKIHPDALTYPAFDHFLVEAMRRETELFFETLIHEDRSIIEILNGDWTYVNERLARHYGIPNITGDHFRRIQVTDENRRGLLGHGSILMMTSVADRTSPVLRGKWVMEVLMASPPPAPPANVPALEETKGVSEARLLTVRERMEQHRANPTCNSCHRVIDPLGLALENFDVTGQWRIKDNGAPIDPAGTLYDGTQINGPVGLRQALMKRSDVIVTSFTESLLTYAVGRRVEAFDMPTIRKIVASGKKNSYKMSSFIMGVINSPAFQMSRAETVETTEVSR